MAIEAGYWGSVAGIRAGFCNATLAITSSPSTWSPLAVRSGRHAGMTAIGVTEPCVFALARGWFIVAPITTPRAVTGVGDRNQYSRSSESAATTAGRRSAGRPLVLWNAQRRSRRPQTSFSPTANRKRARPPVGQLRLMPKRSGTAEGVGDGRCPAPVQVDHSRRRGPFSGL